MNLGLDKSTWQQVTFGEVVRNVNETVKDAVAPAIERIIAMEHMNPGDLKIERWGDAANGTTFTRRVRPGQTLFGKRRAYQRKVAYAEFDAICSGDIYTFEADETRMLGEFLPFLVQSNPFFDHALDTSAGSLSPRTHWRELANFAFSLPPRDEQKRIADLLWAVQRDSASRATELVAVDGLIDIWMRDVGQIDGAERVMLSDLIEHSIGGVWGTDPGTSEIDVTVIRGTDISIGGEIRPAGAPARSIKESEALSRMLRIGDVLVEKSGGSPDQPVGKVGLVREVAGEMVPSNFVLLLRPDRSRCEPTFLFSLLRGMWRHGGFAQYTGKTTNIANLRTKELLAATVRAPGVEHQLQLARQFEALERTRAELSRSVRASASLMTSLTAEVFGGN